MSNYLTEKIKQYNCDQNFTRISGLDCHLYSANERQTPSLSHYNCHYSKSSCHVTIFFFFPITCSFNENRYNQ